MALSIKGTVQELISSAFDATNNWLSASLGSLIHGEDESKDVLGTLPKPVASATYSPLRSTTFGTVVTAVASAQAASIFSAYATNANAAVRYFQIFNRATALSGGEAPLMSYLISAGTANVPGVLNLTSAYFAPSAYLCSGLVWAISTTNAT